VSILPGLSDFVIVNDTTPATNVWDVQRGLFVSNMGAGNYATWLNSGLGVGVPYNTSAISISSAASSDGGTTTTFTVPATTFGPGLSLTTGNTFNIELTGLYDGNQSFTVVDGTHLKIAVAFAGNATGLIVGAQIVATAAGLYAAINSYNVSLWVAGQFLGEHSQTAAGTITLANPMLTVQSLQNGAGASVVLPKMNVPGSIPIGVPITFSNSGNINNGYNLYYNDGVTQVDSQGIAGGGGGLVITYILTDNSTPNGTLVRIAINPKQLWLANFGGTGTSTLPADAQILVGDGFSAYAPQTVSGDATLADTGVLTLSSIIAAGGPTGDASHVAQITYDAKGRLTAVTSVAINIAASSVSGLAPVATSGSASDLGSGTLPDARLSNTIIAAGPIGDASHHPVITYDAHGRLTVVTNTAIAIASGAVSGLATSATTDTTNASNITSGTLPAAQLPNPSATTLGGIKSLASAASKWINAISTVGQPSATQPAFTDISGSVVASQLPNPSATTLGGVKSLASVAKKWINQIATDGTPSATQPALTDLSDVTSASSWTPTDQSGAALVFSGVSASYTKIGNMVHAYGRVTYPITVDASAAVIGGLPIGVPNQFYAQNLNPAGTSASLTFSILAASLRNTSTFSILDGNNLVNVTNAQLSGSLVIFNLAYPAA
jgi:hypothetical protein